ncbi:DNA-directed RNA polymerase III subunit RPC3 [Entomortierella chlamydospora]|nr:DNA-directed RNA polymerase III subunit RPC3 [Entomortierella chlamydospora]
MKNRLCRLIVREHFGPIVEKVANVLLRKGRMPVGLIANFTSLKPRQVRECLFVMIQHNIAVYAEAQERNRIVTYYEANRAELLHRALIPKVLIYSQKWFEREGEAIASTILAHGKLTVVECLKDIQLNTKSSTLVSGRSEAQRVLAIKKTFTRMVKEKCLIAVKPSDSLTAADKDMADEKRETDKMTLPPTAAELANIRAGLEAQKSKDQNSSIVGLKRTLDSSEFDDFDGDKRRRLMTDGDLVIVEEVESDVYFKINFERFIIRWRNMQIACLYETRLNPTARKIINTILKLAEERMINIKEDFSSPINSILLQNSLPTDINLVDTLEFDPQELGPSNTKPRAGECLEKYLQILEEDQMQILKKDAGRSGQYIISLKAASRILKKSLIQDIVATRFGSPYVRIMNMLLEKGKLEEKQISRFSMMPVKDVREKLTTLCTYGILNLQEVPKTNDRAPSRTFYLWEVLLPRAADSLVDRLYHTMANLRQRRFVEKAKRAVLLEKCERSDVKDDENLLNAAERKELETLNSVLEMLEVQEMRVADMAVTLKEL